jgi:hypothetical protein
MVLRRRPRPGGCAGSWRSIRRWANQDVYGPDAAEWIVTEGRVMVGLDEMPAELIPQAIDALDVAVADKYPVAVTCRSKEYETVPPPAGQTCAG